jgi:hypothetical protein
VLEQHFGQIPKYIKNLLSITGFDILTLSEINDIDIQTIEEFARNKLPALIEKKQYEDYFFIFHKMPSKFEIVPGHKKKIFRMRDFILSRGLDFFIGTVKRKMKASDHSNQVSQTIITPALAPHYYTPPSTTTSTMASPSPSTPVESSYVMNAFQQRTQLNFEEKLHNVIVRWLRKTEIMINDGRDYVKDCKMVFSTNEQDEVVAGAIKCSFCHNQIRVSTQMNSNGKRWIISNFTKHFKKHFPHIFVGEVSGSGGVGLGGSGLAGALPFGCDLEIDAHSNVSNEEYNEYMQQGAELIKRERDEQDDGGQAGRGRQEMDCFVIN